ncbi:MAG: type IV pilus biogenesis protein PilM [Thermoguttaceae bacterium]
MGKVLALDWDRHQLRYVLAVTGRRTVKVLDASAVPMLMAQGEDDPEPRPDPAGTLRARLGRKASRLPALVGVDRASIETMSLTLPPATDAELPELVFHQAMRESATVTDETPLDFLPQSGDPAQPREVLVATLAPEAMRQIRRACVQAGIRPARMLMRPYASASLFLRSESAQGGEPSLLVNLVGDEVDLTVVAEGKIIFTRTARIPQSDQQEETDRRVLAEVGRTLTVAMQHQVGDQAVRQICFYGARGDHQGLVETAGEQFEMPAIELDPFDTVEVARKLVPRQPGSFASLLGMLLDEAHGAQHAIDFLNPRKLPTPPSRRKLYIAVAALLAIGALYVWDQQSSELKKLDAAIAALNQRHNQRRQLATQAAAQIQMADALRAWHAAEINWLDEIRDMSVRFPGGQDLVVLRMNLSPGRGGRGGAVTFSGLARDPKILVGMEKEMRDAYHDISSKRLMERGPGGDLAWSFETSMTVAPRTAATYLAHLPTTDQTTSQVALGTSNPVASQPAATAQTNAQQGGRP